MNQPELILAAPVSDAIDERLVRALDDQLSTISGEADRATNNVANAAREHGLLYVGPGSAPGDKIPAIAPVTAVADNEWKAVETVA